MNTSFQKTAGTDEWMSPKEMIEALGGFDVDPCGRTDWVTAANIYTKEDDGLKQEWFGRVWCNPPYSQPLLGEFCKKMAEHGDGVLLIFARTGNKVWQESVFPKAQAILFLRRRVRFCLPDGTPGGSAGCDSACRMGRLEVAPGAILPWWHTAGQMSKPLGIADWKERW